jgi:putative transposase
VIFKNAVTKEELLKVPQKQPKRGRLWLNDGLRGSVKVDIPKYVWSYDFTEDCTQK